MGLIVINILIVDDEKSICETLSWIFKKEGFEVTFTTNYEEALKLIRGKNFDIFLIDLILQGGHGLDLIRAIKDLELMGTIIIMTGYPEYESLINGIRLDVFDYVSKPIQQEEIKRIIQYALDLQKLKQKL